MRILPRLAFLLVLLPALARATSFPLATALDGSGLTWTSGGAVNWTGQTNVSRDGVDAASATGLAAANAESWIETTVTAPGRLAWQWRLDLGPDNASALEFFVGADSDARQTLVQGAAWTAATEAIEGAGPVKVRWRLLRTDDAPSASTDAAYLDSVAYTPFGPAVLQSPTNVNAHGFTARWALVPDATDYALEIATTADFAGARIIDSIAADATTQIVTGLDPLTTYHYRLVAQGPDSLVATSAALTVATTAIKRPANDAFGSAATLAGVSGSVATTTLDATRETAEPDDHLASVWFTWTAPTAGRWLFTTTAAEFDTTLFLYTGSTLPTLVALAEDDDGGEEGASALEFDADAGVTYRIALDSLSGGQGATTLAWQRLALHTPPANDAFASAALLSGNSGAVDATNLYATAEPAEPAPAARTVWWRWTAPASGFWSVNTTGSEISTTLRLWSGASLGSLALLGTDVAGIPVAAGVTYRISIDGRLGAQGALRLGWSFTVPTVAQTITFASPPDVGTATEPFELAASASSGLPVAFTLVSGPATLGEDGVTLALTGQTGAVTVRANQDGDATRLPAPAVTRTFNVRPPPGNDALAAASVFSGSSGALTGTNLFATAEPSDPFPASHSVWWRWTAPAIGIWKINTSGSSIPAAVSVLSGAAPDDLDLLASEAAGRLEIPVAAGGVYYVAVDAADDLQGAIRLEWSLAAPSRAQTITFDSLPDVGVDAEPLTLVATADSDLPVSFVLVSGPATLDGDYLEFTGRPGTVKINAVQAGDASYKPAATVTRSFVVRAPPDNNDASDAFRLSGASGSTAGTNLYSTAGLADPYPASHSVWWRWTAPSAGIWTVDTTGSAFAATVSILAGAAPDELDLLAFEPGGRVEVPVVAGGVYYVAIDAFADLQGAVRLDWTLAPPSRAQVITFDQALPDLVVGEPGFYLFASADSDLPVAFTLVSGPATLDGEFLEFTGKPGVVTIRATQPGDAVYQAAATVTRSFTVTKLPAIKITFSDLRQTYTGSDISVEATAEPAPRYSDLVITYNGGADLPRHAGTYTIVATADETRATAKLVVAKASLTVAALDQRKLAGQPNPEFSLSYAGFVGSDGESDLARAPLATSTARQTSPGGLYAIKASGGVSPDYDFTYVPGTLEVDSFTGRYEILLLAPDSDVDLPAAKLEFTVAASGTPFTGLITLPEEPVPVSIKGELMLDAETDTASATLDFVVNTHPYRLTLAIPLLGEFAATLASGDTTLGAADDGIRVFVPGPKEKLAWAGAHTALFADPTPLDPESAAARPFGAGHATATIDAKGNLKLAGKLGDTQPLTATLAPGPTGDYRLFAQPYAKRPGSYFAGALPLETHPRLTGRRHLPLSVGARLIWAKAPSPPKPLDKSYRAGFGPLAVATDIEPWLPPTASFPLPTRLGLGVAPAPFGLEYALTADAPITTAQLANLPASLSFALDGKLRLPVANPLGFSLKITPATGAFSGGLTLTDTVPAPTAKNSYATKAFLRKITLSGVLRQPPEPATGLIFGQGHFLLSPLPGTATDEAVSGEIQLLAR